MSPGTIFKAPSNQVQEDSKTAKTGELQAGEMDAIHKLTDTIRNIEKICVLEKGSYSRDDSRSEMMERPYLRRI